MLQKEGGEGDLRQRGLRSCRSIRISLREKRKAASLEGDKMRVVEDDGQRGKSENGDPDA